MDESDVSVTDDCGRNIRRIESSLRRNEGIKTEPNEAAELAKLLAEGTWTHDHPITYETAKGFGLPVRSDISPEFLELMSLYPRPVRKKPTVEYLPEPRRSHGVRK
jgi:hypothetical protein